MQMPSLFNSRSSASVFLAIIFVLIVAGVAVSGHWSLIKEDDAGNKNFIALSENKRTTKEASKLAISASEDVSSADTQSLKSTEARSIVWIDSEAQKNELELWSISRGKVNYTYSDAYDFYDKATLEAMARNNHDVTAMTYLGRRALSMEEMRRWYNMAAIYGSSFALTLAAAKSTGIQATEPEDVKRAALIDALMYKKVAELRNDYYSSRGASIDLYEMHLGINLTEQDKIIAEEKSHQLYDALEARRVQLGLGKFDNSVPEVVEAFYKARGLK